MKYYFKEQLSRKFSFSKNYNQYNSYAQELILRKC
jgi:hypothetical protein